MRQNYDEYGVDEVCGLFFESIHFLIFILSITRKWVPHTGTHITLVFGHVYLHGSTSNVDCLPSRTAAAAELSTTVCLLAGGGQ